MNSLPSSPPADRSPSTALAATLETCRLALALHVEAPDQPEFWAKLQQARREAASAIVLLAHEGCVAQEVRAIIELQRKIAASGACDPVVTADDLAFVEQIATSGPLGLLAAMLLVPAAQWPGAPALKHAPRAYWSAYAAWLFSAPQGFCALGQADAYGAHYLRRLEELARLVAASPTAPHVRNALAAFVATHNSIPLYFSTDSLRRHMELRGRLLTAHGLIDRRADFPAKPRGGFRLRVGFVNRHFGVQTETCTTLPAFEKLDPARFEVQLFAHRYRDTDLEQYARSCAEKFTVLPEDPVDQLRTLRAAELDIVVFGTNVTTVYNEVTRLALHRVAPLQVVNNSSGTTTGLPEIDLYVTGAVEAAAARDHFSERLAVVPGPGLAFDRELDQLPPQTCWSRTALGVHADSLLFVSTAPFHLIGPEVRVAWARLLAATPGARLCLHPFGPSGASTYTVERFSAEWQQELAAAGVASDRLILSMRRLASRSDLGGLLELADVYLDPFPVSGATALVDALEYGVPVVTCEGTVVRARTGAALMRSLGLGELVATDTDTYQAIGLKVAGDHPFRHEIRQRLNAAMDKNPVFFDPAAMSAAFGQLLEQAHDELVRVGPAAFRAGTTTLVAGEIDSEYPPTAWLDGMEPFLAESA